MSLLTTASVWTNNDDNAPKKRVSTLRKPSNVRAFNEGNDDLAGYNESKDATSKSPPTFLDLQSGNDNRQSRVTDMLNKITAISSDNKLADFNPMQNPKITARNQVESGHSEYGRSEDSPIKPPSNPLQSPLPYVEKQQGPGNYTANNNLGNYSNYRTSYDPSKIVNQPYYAKMGLGQVQGQGQGHGQGDDKFMEKINYMIHLLEEQQHERTNNITEEFILYTFLGVFMIFIVDSFARAGKYVR
jgi:hypothetical protein